MDKKFFVVLASGGYDTYDKAVEAAKRCVTSQPTRPCYVLRAEAIVEAAPQPIVVRPLV